MTSDVVRWSVLSSQQNTSRRRCHSTLIHSNAMTLEATTMNSNRAHRPNDNAGRSRHTTSTVSLGRPLANKFILLAIWLVMNQCVSIALSESNVRQAFSVNGIDDPADSRTDDLDELLRFHRIHVDEADEADQPSYLQDFVVHVRNGENREDVDRIAEDHGFVNLGEVSLFFLYFSFYSQDFFARFLFIHGINVIC